MPQKFFHKPSWHSLVEWGGAGGLVFSIPAFEMKLFEMGIEYETFVWITVEIVLCVGAAIAMMTSVSGQSKFPRKGIRRVMGIDIVILTASVATTQVVGLFDLILLACLLALVWAYFLAPTHIPENP